MPPVSLHARNLPTARNSPASRRAARETATESIGGARARLVALVGEEAGRVYPIERGPLLIGRGEDTDVTLAAGDVSRVHACVRHRGGAWLMRTWGAPTAPP